MLYKICQYALILEIPFLSSTICMFSGFTIAAPVYPEFNMYDIREPCFEAGLCYPDDHMD